MLGSWKHNTFALDALMSYAVQHWATMIAESGWEIRVIDPFVFLYFWGLMEKWERDTHEQANQTVHGKMREINGRQLKRVLMGRGTQHIIYAAVRNYQLQTSIWHNSGYEKGNILGYNRRHRYENVNRNKIVALKSRRKVKIKNNVNQKLFI
jgi:hypothetical protein